LETSEVAAVAGIVGGILGAGLLYLLTKATAPPVVAAVKTPAAIEITPGYYDSFGKWRNSRWLNTDGSGYGLNFFAEDTRPKNPNLPTLI